MGEIDILTQARRNVKEARGLKKLPAPDNRYVGEEMVRLAALHGIFQFNEEPAPRRAAPASEGPAEPVQAALLENYAQEPVRQITGHVVKKQPYGRHIREKLVNGVVWVLHATKGWRKA